MEKNEMMVAVEDLTVEKVSPFISTNLFLFIFDIVPTFWIVQFCPIFNFSNWSVLFNFFRIQFEFCPKLCFLQLFKPIFVRVSDSSNFYFFSILSKLLSHEFHYFHFRVRLKRPTKPSMEILLTKLYVSTIWIQLWQKLISPRRNWWLKSRIWKSRLTKLTRPSELWARWNLRSPLK